MVRGLQIILFITYWVGSTIQRTGILEKCIIASAKERKGLIIIPRTLEWNKSLQPDTKITSQ